MFDEKGNFHIVERKNDMIIASVFNVCPNEIEPKATEVEAW